MFAQCYFKDIDRRVTRFLLLKEQQQHKYEPVVNAIQIVLLRLQLLGDCGETLYLNHFVIK